jgi:glycosyltransferase involved in cell wall biosynthesis
VNEPDKGQSDAINKGFLKATGDILTWQNSDDIYLPGAFHKVIQVFTEDSDRDLVFGNIYFINEGDNIIRDLRFIPFNYKSLLYEGTILANQAALRIINLYLWVLQRLAPHRRSG